MRPEFVFPKVAEVLPPATPCAPYRDFRNCQNQLRNLDRHQLQELLKDSLKKICNAEKVLVTRSGKDAIFQCLKGLKSCSEKRSIAMAAYTCPDVAAAAVRAGFRIVPLDAKEQTSSLSKEAVLQVLDNPDLAAVILSNLYGLPDEIPEELEQAACKDLLLIDDACQAAHSFRGESPVGASKAALGVVSFGRGKAYSGVGGGAVIISKNIPPDSIAAKIEFSLETAHNSEISDHLKSYAQWGFATPHWYRIPASIPWLGLGETNCDSEFLSGSMSNVQILHAITQLRRRQTLQRIYSEKSALWFEALDSLTNAPFVYPLANSAFGSASTLEQTIFTRIPLIFERAVDKQRFLRKSLEAGLGASGSYPAPLQSFTQLQGALAGTSSACAELLAQTLVTFPVHSYVAPQHIGTTINILKGL